MLLLSYAQREGVGREVRTAASAARAACCLRRRAAASGARGPGRGVARASYQPLRRAPWLDTAEPHLGALVLRRHTPAQLPVGDAVFALQQVAMCESDGTRARLHSTLTWYENVHELYTTHVTCQRGTLNYHKHQRVPTCTRNVYHEQCPRSPLALRPHVTCRGK